MSHVSFGFDTCNVFRTKNQWTKTHGMVRLFLMLWFTVACEVSEG